MESRRNHRHRRLSLFVVLLVAIYGSPAFADEDQPPIDKANRTSVVYTTPDSAVVEAETRLETPPAGAAPRARPKRKCHLEAVAPVLPGPSGTWSLPQPGEEVPFWVICDDQVVGIIMRRVSPEITAPPAPRDVAMSLREEIPMPTVTIGVSPAGEGLVGSEAWLWIEGYQGESITHSTDAFGSPIEVEARPTAYRWRFGDGVVFESHSLGRPYPERSDVRHVYQRSSIDFPRGFPIEVEFSFSVRYRISGGAWIELPSITRFAHLDYPVRESQAVISR